MKCNICLKLINQSDYVAYIDTGSGLFWYTHKKHFFLWTLPFWLITGKLYKKLDKLISYNHSSCYRKIPLIVKGTYFLIYDTKKKWYKYGALVNIVLFLFIALFFASIFILNSPQNFLAILLMAILFFLILGVLPSISFILTYNYTRKISKKLLNLKA